MQNAHLNCYSAKVPRLTTPFGEAAPCSVAASALKFVKNYTYITPPPVDFSHNKYYVFKDTPTVIYICLNLSGNGMFIVMYIKEKEAGFEKNEVLFGNVLLFYIAAEQWVARCCRTD